MPGLPPRGHLLATASGLREREAHPGLRGYPNPRHVHVAVQKVQLGLQGQDQAGERGTRVKRAPASPAGSRPSLRLQGAGEGGARRTLTGPAWRCRCRLFPTPSPSRGPPQSAGAAACAPNPSGGSRLEQRETRCQGAPGQPPGRTAKGLQDQVSPWLGRAAATSTGHLCEQGR